LLEAGRDEEFIEKDTGVSDRTIRRWKMELERTGRIGKPPESRTGRHRVLNAEVETVSTSAVARGLGCNQYGRVS
jgi:transposase